MSNNRQIAFLHFLLVFQNCQICRSKISISSLFYQYKENVFESFKLDALFYSELNYYFWRFLPCIFKMLLLFCSIQYISQSIQIEYVLNHSNHAYILYTYTHTHTYILSKVGIPKCSEGPKTYHTYLQVNICNNYPTER